MSLDDNSSEYQQFEDGRRFDEVRQPNAGRTIEMESAFSVSVLMALVSFVSASLPLAAAGSDTETASEQYDNASLFLTA